MTDKDFLIDALNHSRVDIFDDADANAAAERVNQTIADMLIAGNNAKELSLIQKIFFVQDAVLVAEATLDYFQSNQHVRDLISTTLGEEIVWRTIAHWKTALAQGHKELIELKQQLAV